MLRTAPWQILLNKMVVWIFLMLFFILIVSQLKSLFYNELQENDFFFTSICL